MIYFRTVSLVFGLYLFLVGLWIFIFPQKYKAWVERFLFEKRPLWYVLTSLAMVLWVLYTWYRFLQFPTGLSFAVTFVLTLSLVKVYLILFKYPQFLEYARTFLSMSNSILRTLAVVFVALGICLTAIGLAL